MILIQQDEGTNKFQAFCSECGAIGSPVDDEAAADEFGFAHRQVHPDVEDDITI